MLMINVLSAQDKPNNPGNWLMGFSEIRFHDKWGLHAEIQYRSFEALPNTEQLLLRSGINFHINKQHSLTAGYARIHNYAFDKDVSPGLQTFENRIWQQYFMKNSISRVFFQHRYRIEQRFLKSQNNPSNYLTRFRYFLRISIPFNNAEIIPKTIYASFYNEIFIHLDDAPFDRNRLFGAIGYKVRKNLDLQLGYLLQSSSRKDHLLQMAIFYNIDLRKN